MNAVEKLKTAHKIAFGQRTISPAQMLLLEGTVERAGCQLRKENGNLYEFTMAFRSINERVEMLMACTLGNYQPITGSDEELEAIGEQYGPRESSASESSQGDA